MVSHELWRYSSCAVALFVVVVISACGSSDSSTTLPIVASTPGAVSLQPSGLIKQVILAKGTEGAAHDPKDPTTTFSPNSTLHAVVTIQNAPANTKFHTAWYFVDVGGAATPNSLVAGTDLVAEGSRNLDFDLTPIGKFPVGSYRVEISVNGVPDQVATFSVK